MRSRRPLQDGLIVVIDQLCTRGAPRVVANASGGRITAAGRAVTARLMGAASGVRGDVLLGVLVHGCDPVGVRVLVCDELHGDVVAGLEVRVSAEVGEV